MVLTAKQARRLISAAITSNYHALIAMAITTGMRQGELFALAWGDIDFKIATVDVSKSLEEVKGRLKIKSPKTRAGRRTLALDQFSLDALKEHLAWGKQQGVYGEAIVFPTARGTYARKSNFARRHWQSILKRAQLDGSGVTFHGLRHHHGSLLAESGATLKSIQERLGHSRSSFTADVYVHSLKKVDRTTSDIVSRELFDEG